MTPPVPQPGDFAVIDSRSQVGFAVDAMETLSGGGFSQFSHAVICSRVETLPDGRPLVYIVEAMPDGAVEVLWHYASCDHLWSTGVIETPAGAGEAARAYVGWGYNWLDYAAIAAHTWHLPFAPQLIARSDRLRQVICSVLVARAYLDAGVRLAPARKDPGYVRPADLADLILGKEGLHQ